MASPSEMPKKSNKLRMQLLAGLIETRRASWTQKIITKDEDGKELVESLNHEHHALRYPLAANVSEENIDRAAKSW